MPGTLPDLIPARILDEHVDRPRLAYLEWVDRQFADNADTADGTFVHRVVDRERAKPPDPSDAPGAQAEDGEPPPSSSAVTVSSERLGLIAKVDLVEARGRHGRAGRVQARQPTFSELAALGACVCPALRTGADPARYRLPGSARRGLLRADADPPQDRDYPGADRPDHGGDQAAAGRLGPGRAAGAARRQPEVPALLTRRDMPARRGERAMRAGRATDAAPRGGRPARHAALREQPRQPAVQARWPCGPARGRFRDGLQAFVSASLASPCSAT